MNRTGRNGSSTSMCQLTAEPSLRRRMLSPAWAEVALLLLGAVAIALVAGDYGIAWDDPVQAQYGELVLRYFSSGGTDRSCNEFIDLRFYGPAFELLAAILCRLFHEPAYLVRHGLTALAGLMTLPALYRISRHLGSAWIGVLAGAALLLLPRFCENMFINSKDIPFACLFAWTMAMLLDHFAAEQVQWSRAVALGVVAGLMLSVRPAGLALAGLVGGLLVLWKWWSRRRDGWPDSNRFALSLTVVGVIAWIIMVLPWPYAHENPLLNPIRAIQVALHFYRVFPVLFEGQVITSDALPHWYLPEYLAITTPLVVAVVALAGLVAGVLQQRQNPRGPRAQALFLAQAWLVVPVILCVTNRPNIYDGLRHFLFLLPAIALWYAIGMAAIISRMCRSRWRAVGVIAAVIMTLLPLRSIVALHPYQNTYFNSLVGGVAGAEGRYEMDYWITSYREAIEWVNCVAAQQPGRTFTVRAAMSDTALGVVTPFSAANVQVFANAPDFELSLSRPERVPDRFDFYIATTRFGWDRYYPLSPVVHTVGREGAIFTVIRGH